MPFTGFQAFSALGNDHGGLIIVARLHGVSRNTFPGFESHARSMQFVPEQANVMAGRTHNPQEYVGSGLSLRINNRGVFHLVEDHAPEFNKEHWR